MKKLLLLPVVALACAFTVYQQTEIKPIEIGTAMPKTNVGLLDVTSEKEITLAASKGEMGTLVLFSCNTCPFVVAQESRIKNLQSMAQRLHLGMIVVNSNVAQRDADDSKAAMKAYAADKKYTVPYVMDSETELADAFGATRTPEAFLFDKNDKLVYHGSIDDSPRDEKSVKTQYLLDAMTMVSKDKEVTTKTTVSTGCGIKRKK
jgi:thioredoxin-related protein